MINIDELSKDFNIVAAHRCIDSIAADEEFVKNILLSSNRK